MGRLPDGRIVPRFVVDAPAKLHHSPDAYVEWFEPLDDVARSAGRDSADDIRADLCSDDVLTRYHAYADIYGHHGLDNFDSYPDDVCSECRESSCDCVKEEESDE